jgi:hypothetical protein
MFTLTLAFVQERLELLVYVVYEQSCRHKMQALFFSRYRFFYISLCIFIQGTNKYDMHLMCLLPNKISVI